MRRAATSSVRPRPTEVTWSREVLALPQPPLAPLSSFAPRRQDGESCFHNLDVLSLTSRHFLLSNLSLIFPIRSFLSKEERPLQKRAVCLGCAPTVVLLRGPRCRPTPPALLASGQAGSAR